MNHEITNLGEHAVNSYTTRNITRVTYYYDFAGMYNMRMIISS